MFKAIDMSAFATTFTQ